MIQFVFIALVIGSWPFKATTDASPVWKLADSSKILPDGSTAQEADAATKNESIAPVSSRTHPLMAGPPLNTPHYGATKKIEFFNPLKQIKQGKIKYTYQHKYEPYGDKGLARAFKTDFSDEQFGWFGYKCPQMLWCQFDDPKVPAGVTFLPSQSSDLANQFHVTKWQFVASKDYICNERSPWKVICEDLSGTGYMGKDQGKVCFAGEEIQEKYRCIGIRVLEGKFILGKYVSGAVDDEFMITNIIMYEKVAGYN